MLSGSELEIAIAAVLVGAVCLGFVLHWLWIALRGGARDEAAQLAEMRERLHDAELDLETAEVARRDAEARIAGLEAETAERLAAMQARLEGAAGGREAELARELADARREIEVLDGGLSNARQRIIYLEAEIERLRGGPE